MSNTSKRHCKLNTRLLSPVFASFSRTRRFWLSQNPLLQCLIPNTSNFVPMSHCFLFLQAALWDFPNVLEGRKRKLLRRPCSHIYPDLFSTTLDILVLLQCLQTSSSCYLSCYFLVPLGRKERLVSTHHHRW